ncbi:Dipeptide transport ATP-binding protein DppD [Desulfosporosinus sp. BG]|nr:dipeptide/oligopeptide/nickel ABC transporter ATP-binding protein [Desulfosporosinus sp. BG]ODA42098.1 Dipeptide transport ATP-binding protein DppD [Desulfosporosinus sp. BG]
MGIIGEFGSGKTSIALAMMGLLKKAATVDGQVNCHCISKQFGCSKSCLDGTRADLGVSPEAHCTDRNGLKGKTIKVCDNCDLTIRSGEVVALIGESGSGKTTLAGILAGVLTADEGEVMFEGEKIKGNKATSRKNGIQIVFQDPFTATNEHLSIAQVIKEPLDILKLGTKEEKLDKVRQALQDVQLPSDDEFIARKCHCLSGGQKQRVALARSLVMEPKPLIADEISSMLDPSTQANVLRLLKGLQNAKGFAMLYITHDLALARKIADRVYIMYNGRIIEHGSVVDVFDSPKESYTNKLVNNSL